uniref:hypothetical protein n=1 Tax=Endozoicomonas sp. ONNA2 TaxID=2828741 RepID=UPI0021480C95
MPIPPADSAALRSTGNGTSTNHGSKKRQRKRSRAGYQVEQTTIAANILTKHQKHQKHQKFTEQPLTPPIKLRRVHDGRSVVSSIGEQPAQEPMETEPAITARTESLTVAVFGLPSENPQPTSGNIPSSETTPTPGCENIEPMEVDDPAEIPSEVLSMFLPEHQEAIQVNLINENLEINQHLNIVVENAEKLLKMLSERKIELSKNRSKPPFPTLFSLLKAFSITENPELFSNY